MRLPSLALSLTLLTPLAAQAAPPLVVADTPVSQSLAAQVMGTLGTPQLLIDPGSDPHHVQLRPSQVQALQSAGLVVWMGHAMSPWLEEVIEARADGQAVALLEIPGTTLHVLEEDDDHHDEEEDDHGHHAGDGHDHASDIDPHAWLLPENAALWVTALAEDLAKLDPENAQTYRANGAQAANDITALAAEMETTLAPAQDAHFIAYHDAYGYLSDRFRLHFDDALADTEATPPSAKRLADLAATDTKVTCIFVEPQHSPKLALRLAESIGARTASLDPSGSTLPAGPFLYRDMMRQMAATIADCAN